MPTASILTKTVNQTVSRGSPTNVEVTWDVETKYLDADVDFFDAGTSNFQLAVPGSLDGVPYEVFLWVEDTANDWSSGSGAYFGFLSSGLPGVNINDFGIIRDVGRPAYGSRTGLILGDSDGANFWTRAREFESHTMTFGTRCRLGIIAGNPNPLAVAAAIESGKASGGASENTLVLTEEFDFGDCYDPSTGIYTAPAGASLAVPNINGYITSGTGGDVDYAFRINGTEQARMRHAGSVRGWAPGTFGLVAVSPGDEIDFRIQDDSSGRSGYFQTSVEFY